MSCQRIPFLATAIVLILMNMWIWCNVFSLDCRIRMRPSNESTNHPTSHPTVPDEQLRRALRNSLCGSNGSIVPEVDLSSLVVPTLSPADRKEIEVKILKMSKLKKEYELDEMNKKIDKNEHHLKRVNVSISLSKENNPNFVKRVEQCRTQLPELERKLMNASDEFILYIHKLLDDLLKTEERMKRYKNLLDKQKGFITRKLALQYNLTFFESVIHR